VDQDLDKSSTDRIFIRVLKEIAKRLSQHARDEDTVCRNGGDEFLYLLMNPQGGENIQRIAGVVLKDIAQPIDVGDLQLVIKSSIGIAVYPDNGPTGEQLKEMPTPPCTA
jgi:diguanylate cyclase